MKARSPLTPVVTPSARQWLFSVLLAATVSVVPFATATADVGNDLMTSGYTAAPQYVNQTYQTTVVNGLGDTTTSPGNDLHFNTPGGMTTFVGNGTLVINNSSTINAFEVDPGSFQLNGNGGHLHFSNPGGVVHFSGANVNVSGVWNGSAYVGNGGNITVDAGTAILDNGTIFSLKGGAGGLAMFNVGSALLYEGSEIHAQGFNGPGGKVAINATGVVQIGGTLGGGEDSELPPVEDIRGDENVLVDAARRGRNVIIDTSGRVVGSYDRNVISIEGGVVKIAEDALLMAKGLNPLNIATETAETITDKADGGTIRIVSGKVTGCTNCSLDSSVSVLGEEKVALLKNWYNDLKTQSGNVLIEGQLNVDGAESSAQMHGGDGGQIFVSALNDAIISETGVLSARGGNGSAQVFSEELIREDYEESIRGDEESTNSVRNGGNGGLINVNALNNILFSGQIHAYGGNGFGYYEDAPDNLVGGFGGRGGLIAFGYGGNFFNTYVDSLNTFVVDGNPEKLINSQFQIDASGGHNGQNGINYDNNHGGLVLFYGNNPIGIDHPNGTGVDNVSVFRGLEGGGEIPDKSRFGVLLVQDPGAILPTYVLNAPGIDFSSSNTATVQGFTANEVLWHKGNLLLFSQDGGTGSVEAKFQNAYVRDVFDPLGSFSLEDSAVNRLSAFDGIRHFSIFNTNGALTLNKPSTIGPAGFKPLMTDSLGNLHTFNVLAQGPLTVPLNWNVGQQLYEAGSDPVFDSLAAQMGGASLTEGSTYKINDLGGGHISLLSNDNVTITENGQLNTKGHEAGGSIHVVSGNDLLNQGRVETEARRWLVNDMTIGEGDMHAGSIILKAANNLLNLPSSPEMYGVQGVIESGGGIIGGNIHLFGGVGILNAGKVLAIDSGHSSFASSLKPLGGIIQSQAGILNLNLGEMSASATSGLGGYGGYLHQHAGVWSVNLDPSSVTETAFNLFTEPFGTTLDSSWFDVLPGLLQANGKIGETGFSGGRVLLTAGQLCCGDGFGSEELPQFANLLSGTLPLLQGFGVTGLTPPETTMNLFIDPNIAESALNFGHMNATGQTYGNIYVAGNSQVGLADQSSFNGDILDYNGILSSGADSDTRTAALRSAFASTGLNGGNIFLVAGNVTGTDGVTRSAVEAVACDAAQRFGEPNVENPENEEESESPLVRGAAFPRDFRLPGGGILTDDDLLGFDSSDLFDAFNLLLDDNFGQTTTPVQLGVAGGARIMLNRAYHSVTQQILFLALQNYNRELTLGRGAGRATEKTLEYLTKAQVDPEAAKEILAEIEEGTLQADGIIVDILKKISSQVPAAESDAEKLSLTP